MNETKETVATWNSIWRKMKNQISQWDDLSQLIYEILQEEIGDITNKHLLEAGSGTGTISLKLSSMGAKVALLDATPSLE